MEPGNVIELTTDIYSVDDRWCAAWLILSISEHYYTMWHPRRGLHHVWLGSIIDRKMREARQLEK